MRKIFSKSLLAILTFCLVLMLVACDPVEPIDNGKTAEEWGIDVNYTERKPFEKIFLIAFLLKQN